MNFFKKINYITLNWAIEALAKDEGDVEEEINAAKNPVKSQEFNDFEKNLVSHESKNSKTHDNAFLDRNCLQGIDFAVGGQAVIEGVMMRSPNGITISVREPDGGIAMQQKKYHTLTQRFKWLNIPIIRGVVNLFEMMIIGTNAINYSASVAMPDEEPKKDKISEKTSETSKDEKILEPEKSKLSKIIEGTMFALSFIFAMAISLSLFKFVPFWVTTFLSSKSSFVADNYIVFNLIDGIIKMTIFLSYIFILSRIKSFRRIFEYHGAEHKAIFNYEKKEELNVENSAKQTRFHPRCGTSFILIVFVISIIFYTFIPQLESFWATFALRVAVLPLIAGISYEYLKFSAKHTDKAFVKMMVAPGLWFQRLTTQEPDKSQLEISLNSLKKSLEFENKIA